MRNEIEQFKVAIQSAGLEPPDVIEPGKMHRFPTNGKRGDDAGWCKLFPDMLGGVFGDHRSGLSDHWQAKTDRVMTASEREAFRRMVVESKHQAELEERKRHEAAALKAAAILDAATGDPATHSYLVKKRVSLGSLVKRGPWPQRGWSDALLVPIYGVDGRLWSIEAINEDGGKDFLAGGKTSGCFHPFGKIRDAGRVLIGEGVATVLSASAASRQPAIAALSSGNLPAVAKVMRERYPAAALVVLADLLKTTGEPEPHAIEAALVVGGLLAVPDFGDNRPEGASDFNDLAQHRGPEAVRTAIANAKPPASPEHGSDTKKRASARNDGDGSTEQSRLATVETFVQSVDPTKPPRRRPQTDILIDIGLKVSIVLFCGDDDRPYAVIGDRCEVWPIASRRFREWLRGCYFSLASKGANANSIRDAVETISSKAQFLGEKRKVFLRVAEAGGKFYIDLTDNDWRVVEIDRDGWRILNNSPVMFARRGAPAPLPAPEKGGTIQKLWGFLNVKESDRPLVAGWLLMALTPRGPFPVLVLNGEEDSTKSTLAAMLRLLCDPSLVLLRAPTKDERDFLVGAVGNWCVTIDNLSGLQRWLSDALCRLSTGGGFSARTLYTDCDETVVSIKRPVILNGIDAFVVRGDLVSRSIVLKLEVIEEDKRRDELELWEKFEAARPHIFGVLLTALSSAIRKVDKVKLTRRPRMVDFARWVTAAETELGFKPDEFLNAYMGNLEDSALATLETVVAQALIAFIRDRLKWEGTATELLERIAPPIDGKPNVNDWPRSGRGMTSALNRLAPALRRIEISVEHLVRSDAKGSRRIRLVCKVPAQSSEPSVSSEASTDAGSRSDGSKHTDDSTVRESGQPSETVRKSTNEINGTDDTDGSDGSAGALHTWSRRI